MDTEQARIRLMHILQEAEAIARHTAGCDLTGFQDNWLVRRSVQHGLLIIGEAVRNVPSALKDKYPEVPWERIRALGNVLRHEYQHIDDDRIWDIVTVNLPTLAKVIRHMLAELEC